MITVGWNYSTAAVLFQFLGRNIAGGNVLNIGWMRRVEATGMITVFFYFLVERNIVTLPADKLVLTEGIRKWIEEYPNAEVKKQEDHVMKWFDGQEWAAKYPLFRAILSNDIEGVKLLLSNGVPCDQTHVEWHNSNPMQWASAGGKKEIMKILMFAGANPFGKEVYKNTKTWKQPETGKFL